MLTESFFSLSA